MYDIIPKDDDPLDPGYFPPEDPGRLRIEVFGRTTHIRAHTGVDPDDAAARFFQDVLGDPEQARPHRAGLVKSELGDYRAEWASLQGTVQTRPGARLITHT